jgi:curved DNA-binding protein CbpA
VKDYYQILGVPATAAETEIKKAFRQLAHRYHPDKNRETHSAARFQEIKEAYEVLSNSWLRARYDEDRAYAGKTRSQPAITPDWLLQVSRQLTESLAKMDAASINYGNLQAYILLILSDAHVAVLMHHNEAETNSAIVNELMLATNRLPIRNCGRIQQKLVYISNTDKVLVKKINDHYAVRLRQFNRQRLFPLVVIIITMLLMAIMMLLPNR